MSETKKTPKIILVGPTNVGKSTLFNRLTHTRAAIVADRPGVTVDRHEMKLAESPIGEVEIIDTGGVGPSALDHPLGKEIERAASRAVEDAAICLFVVDGTKEPGLDELEAASWLRRQKGIDDTPIWTVVNKMDARKCDPNAYYALGFERVIPVSAEHGEGIDDLWTQLQGLFGEHDMSVAPAEPRPAPRILVLGRPNVGKSTLLNQIIGTDRHVVSETAGTTRDVIETEYERHGMLWRLADTAGIRQPGRLERGVEWVAREKLKDNARGAQLAILVVDSSEGVNDLDASIAGMAIDFGMSLVVVYNKWDLMSGKHADEDKMTHLSRSVDLKFDFLKWCPAVRLSGLTGKGLGPLMKAIEKTLEERALRVQTSVLNRMFEKKLRLHAHPIGPRGKPAKFYYLSQVANDPPEFVFFSNLPASAVHFSFKRYITNSLREEFGFQGTPIKLHFKTA